MDLVRSSVIIACLLTLVAVASSKTFCCISALEYRKCVELKQASSAFDSFGCFKAAYTGECITAIKHDLADMMFLDGGDIFQYRNDGLVVVAAENYGEEDASYFAVAVVKNNAREDISMLNLDGTQSCHTAIGKTAGWNAPMGLIARTHNSIVNGRLPLYNPFTASCAPGAKYFLYQQQLPDPDNHLQWCALCVGNENDPETVCDRDSDENYYGYAGALRCLKENEGINTVAFVKHTTIPPEERDNFKLLCRDGSRAHPSDWRSCNLAKVPSHGLVMRAETSDEEAAEVVKQLKATKGQTGSLFLNFHGKKNLLWTTDIIDFMGPFVQSPVDFLGLEYFCSMLAVNRDPIDARCM